MTVETVETFFYWTVWYELNNYSKDFNALNELKLKTFEKAGFKNKFTKIGNLGYFFSIPGHFATSASTPDEYCDDFFFYLMGEGGFRTVKAQYPEIFDDTPVSFDTD